MNSFLKSKRARVQDLITAIFGYFIGTVSYLGLDKIPLLKWQLKFGCYAGFFTMLIYFLRLKVAAEGVDPDSNKAFKQYLKLGSCYVFILFISELPLMVAML